MAAAHPQRIVLNQARQAGNERLPTLLPLLHPQALDAIVDTYETKVGPHNGARVVARAWVDPEYKRRLLQDATAADRDVLVVESAADETVAWRMNKAQRMRWSRATVQPFLDVRTAVLNDTLEQAFRRRHHGFRPVNDNHGLTAAAA